MLAVARLMTTLFGTDAVPRRVALFWHRPNKATPSFDISAWVTPHDRMTLVRQWLARWPVDRPLPTGRVACELPVMVIRQERDFEPSVHGVLGTNKEPKAEGADRKRPGGSVVAAPTADKPRDNESDQPDAADP